MLPSSLNLTTVSFILYHTVLLSSLLSFNGILFFFSLYVIVSGESLRGIHYIHLLYCTIELERRETKYCRILVQSEF